MSISDEFKFLTNSKPVELLKNSPQQTLGLDEISIRTQMAVAQVSAFLLNLELLGLVRALPGKKFSLPI